MRPHVFLLRRDFADELGYGEYLLNSGLKNALPVEEVRKNFELGLSPRMPRFIAYYRSAGKGMITSDGTDTFEASSVGLFEVIVDKLNAGIEANALLRAAKHASLTPPSLDATADGFPTNVVLHDTRTGEAYFIRAREAFEILRQQFTMAAA